MKQIRPLKVVQNSLFAIASVLGILALTSCPNSLLGELQQQLEINFGQLTNTVTVTAGTGGSVTPTGAHELKSGEILDISAIPDTGKQFFSWMKIGGGGTEAFGDINAATTTVSVSGGDITIQALFGDQPRSLTVQALSNGSITTPSSSPVTVSDGSPYAIAASPATGYNFGTWSWVSGGGTAFDDPSSSSTNVTVTGGDAEISASFTPKQYTMNVTVNDASRGGLNIPTSNLVTHGVPFDIEASDPTSPGYYFSGWEKTGGTGNVIFADFSNQSTTATVTNGDVTIRANFIKIDVHLEALGHFDLNDTNEGNLNKRMNDPRDFVYNNGYVYVVGDHNSDTKVIKINVSNPDNLTYTATGDVSVGSSVTSVIVADSTYLNIAVPGTGIRKVTLSTVVESYYHGDSDVKSITNGWYATGSLVHAYNFPTENALSPFDNVASILYLGADKDCLYVTGSDDMGSSGGIRPLFADHPNYWIENTMNFNNVFLGRMTLTAQERFAGDTRPITYVYVSAGDDGLYTFFVDDPTSIEPPAIQGTSANTGTFVDMVTYGHYLITGGTTTGYDKFSIYDIHLNNGSISQPFWLENFDSFSDTMNIVAMDMYGSYLYVIEGTILRIYAFTSATE